VLIFDALTFFFRPGNGIVDGEDVVWVNRVLDLLLPVNCHPRQSSVDKLFPDLTNAVMVTD